MIPVAMADEPASFDALVRQPGRIVTAIFELLQTFNQDRDHIGP